VTERARREYAEALRTRYQQADKVGKGQMLDEYCRVTRVHRKAAIRCLRRIPRSAARPPGRPRRYAAPMLPILERVWTASDYLCGKLLAPMMPVLVAALEQHHGLHVAPVIRAALLTASPATLDRQLRLLRRRRGRPPRRVAPALHALRSEVPLRTWGDWAGVAPGALQGDLVLHCGESTHGFYLASLVTVDVATSWIELQPLWGLHQQRVRSGVHLISTRLPFRLREWHSDNGSEFLNTVLLHWCRHAGIRVTRGRPYRKNDQAWVEQRNWLAVRRLVGYDRYTSRPAFAALGRLYTLLRLQLNFFRPVRKLVSKHRVGAKTIKRYDRPQTPYQRVLAAGVLSPPQQHALAAQLAALDPIALARDIQRTLDTLWTLAAPR
jgi:integrase-like protein